MRLSARQNKKAFASFGVPSVASSSLQEIKAPIAMARQSLQDYKARIAKAIDESERVKPQISKFNIMLHIL